MAAAAAAAAEAVATFSSLVISSSVLVVSVVVVLAAVVVAVVAVVVAAAVMAAADRREHRPLPLPTCLHRTILCMRRTTNRPRMRRSFRRTPSALLAMRCSAQILYWLLAYHVSIALRELDWCLVI